MKRPAATFLVIGTTLFMVITGLAMALVVSVAASSLSAYVPVSSGPPPAPVTGSSTPDEGRLADYTFGHTAGHLPSGGPGVGTDLTQRIPFTLSSQVTSMRLHVRNWSYIDDKPLAGRIDISTIAIGRAASGEIPGDTSAFAAAPAVLTSGTSLTDGAEYVSDWVGADAVGFERNTPFFLSMGFSSAAGTEIGIAGNVSWLLANASPAAATTQASVGAFTMAGSFLDMWLEYTYSSDEKLIVVAGHSLNSGANGNVAEHPHTGENSAWHQIWADTDDEAAASMSTPGSWTVQFPPDSPKWNIYEDLKPDAFVLWSASNDIAGGESLDVLKTAWLASLAKAKSLWPDARIFVMTEPGRGLTDEREANRNTWNDWLRSDTSGAFTVVDADAVLSDPAQPNVLNPTINGDNAHPAPAGNALVAQAFECAFAGC